MPATPKRGGARKRTSAKTTTSTAQWEPVLRGADSIVPGEVLLTLRPDAAETMTGSVPLHPSGVFGAASTLGVDELDSVLAELGAHDITRLAPSPVGIAGAAALAGDELGQLEPAEHTLARSFRVRIEIDSDVEAAAARLAEVDSVEVAEPNRWRETMVTPDDPQFGSQWGLTKIKAPAAWDVTTGSPSVVVGVVDSGCDLDHPELAPLLVNGYDMVDLGPNPTPPPGWRFEGDFAGRDATPEDEVGHGTHVAGTIAALTDNGTQVAGVGWQTKIMPVKALTRMVRISDGRVSGVGSSADVAAAVRWAADNGAHVINMSLGSDAQTTVERNAIAYAIGKGVVVVAAMGNDGSANPSYPAAYPDVVAVGAIDSADHRASFSQTGGHISLVAPGVGIVSTYLAGGTTTMSGTSMATPHVAGVAALIKAVKPSATGAEIADILRQTTRPLRDDPADPVPNDRYGYGCLNAEAAVLKARGGPVLNPTITHLRTPIIACPPKTLLIHDCPVLTAVGPLCPPKTILPPVCPPFTRHPAFCPPITPRCPVTKPPTTFPPTLRTVPTQPIGRGQATAGYDPYGLLGTQGSAAPGGGAQAAGDYQAGYETGGDYQAGYEAGYEAAMAEVQAAVEATQADAGDPADATGGPDVQAGPGDVYRPFPRSWIFCPPHTINIVQCVPQTVGTPFCPIPTPTLRTFPTPTYRPNQPGGYGYGEWGWDPYGQSPFQG